MVHGIGAETLTQVMLLATAAGTGGDIGTLALLVIFLAGLLASNTLIALAATCGFLAAGRSCRAYAIVSLLTALASLVVGVLFLAGRDRLPALFAG
jgi:hypothetical protein